MILRVKREPLPDVICGYVSYQFDDFVVDPVGFRLIKAGRPVSIEPKALQILIALIERRDRPMSKQELFDEIWPGVVVTENALTRAIAQLRKTLGDKVEAPRYIETVPTRGYRFIGRMQTDDARPVAGPARGTRKIILIAIVAVTVVVILFIVSHLKPKGKLGEATNYPPPIAARPLHASEKFEVSPSFSPDGASIVYSADVNGTLHLFVSTLHDDSGRQLTYGEAGEAQPSWSPDGRTIAYTSVRKGGIWLMSVNGGAPVQLTRFGSRPSWSPDGTEIAFQSAADIEYGWNAYEALPPSTIWIVNVASGKVVPLTMAAHPPGGHGRTLWNLYDRA